MFNKKKPSIVDRPPRNKQDDKIMEAVLVGDAPKLRSLIKANKHTSLTTPDDEGRVAIYEACRLGLMEIAEILLSTENDASYQDEEGTLSLVYGRSPLHVAADKGYVDCVEVLLKKGANVNAFDNRNQCALHIAACMGNVDLLETLLAFKAETEIPDRDGNTPLLCAAKYNQLGPLTKLLNASANTNAINRAERTALMFACEHGNKEMVQLLLSRGATTEKRDTGGRTARGLAVLHGHQAVAALLPDDPAVPDGMGPLGRRSSSSRVRAVSTSSASAEEIDRLKKDLQAERDNFVILLDELSTLKLQYAAFRPEERLDDTEKEDEVDDDEEMERAKLLQQEIQNLKDKVMNMEEQNASLESQLLESPTKEKRAREEQIGRLNSQISLLQEKVDLVHGDVPVVPMVVLEQIKGEFADQIEELERQIDIANQGSKEGATDMKNLKAHYESVLESYRTLLLAAVQGTLTPEQSSILQELAAAA